MRILRSIFFLPPLVFVCALGMACALLDLQRAEALCEVWADKIIEVRDMPLQPREWIADAIGLTLCAAVWLAWLLW